MTAKPGESDDEREGVSRCISGDASAWDAFVRRFEPLLAREVRFALRRLRGREDPSLAQDLLQDVFQALLADGHALLRGFRWESSLGHYLSVVVFTRVANSLKSRALRPLEAGALEEAWERRALKEEAPEIPDPVETEEDRERIQKALLRLPARERLALRFHYRNGLPPETIARLLSIQADSVRMLLSRARRRLRDFLKGARCL